MLALVTPTVTSSGQTWVRTDPRWLWDLQQVVSEPVLNLTKPRLCLHQHPSHAMTEAFPISSLETMPSPWRCTSLADTHCNFAYKSIFNYRCLESQKGGWECLQQSCEQIQLPTQCPGPISNSAKIMKTCLVLHDMMLCVGPAEYVTAKRGCCRSLQYSWFPKPYKSAKGREICMGPDGYVTQAQCTVL